MTGYTKEHFRLDVKMLGLIDYLRTHTRMPVWECSELIHKGLLIGLTIPQMEILKANLEELITCMLLGMSYAQVLQHQEHLGLLYTAVRSGLVEIQDISSEQNPACHIRRIAN
jgi:hypothetical protein